MERDLAKVEAAGSSPVSRSKRNTKRWYPVGYHLFCVFEPRRDSKVRGLRSAPVVAKRTSTGCSATSRALISKRVHVDIIFVFPIPPGLEGSRSPLRSGRCKTNIHRMFCNVSRSNKQEGTCGYYFCISNPAGLEGSRSPLCSGRCKTNIHRMFCNVSRSNKQEGTCGYYFCISNPAGLEGSRSPFHSGHCKTNVHRTFCNVSRSKRNTKKQRKYTENLACFRYKDKNFAEKDKMLCLLSRL